MSGDAAMELTTLETNKVPIKIGEHGVQFESAAEMFRIAQAMVVGGVCPAGMTPGGAMASMLKGRSLGLDEITSLGSIVVIKGRTQMQGSLLLALLKRAGVEYDISYTGDDKTREAHIEAWWPKQRARAKKRSFGYVDALRAGLVGKDTYRAWPDDMYLWRAVAKLARQEFPEIGAGIYVYGEVPGDPAPTIDETPAPAALPAPVVRDTLLDELSAPAAELVEALSGEPVIDVPTFTSTSEPPQAVQEQQQQAEPMTADLTVVAEPIVRIEPSSEPVPLTAEQKDEIKRQSVEKLRAMAPPKAPEPLPGLFAQALAAQEGAPTEPCDHGYTLGVVRRRKPAKPTVCDCGAEIKWTATGIEIVDAGR